MIQYTKTPVQDGRSKIAMENLEGESGDGQ